MSLSYHVLIIPSIFKLTEEWTLLLFLPDPLREIWKSFSSYLRAMDYPCCPTHIARNPREEGDDPE